MKKSVLTALVLALFCLLPLRADASYYRETTLSGGVKIVFTERVVIPSPYITAYTYDKCGVLAPDGTFLVEPVYQSISAPVEGRALFYREGAGYGYFDENWNVVIPAQYQTAANFSEGLAAVTNAQKMVGYIDKSGKTVVPFQYSVGSSFKGGVASVTRVETGYSSNVFTRAGVIDRLGNAVEPVAFQYEDEAFDVLMSENRVSINGKVYENDSLRYPFINYQGCSYIPLTFGTCRALGFSCLWSEKDGLALTPTASRLEPEQGGNTMAHGVYGKATLYTGKLTIGGKTYTAGDLYYPLLFYRDVIYLPVLYREGMERLGIHYSYRPGEGIGAPGYMVFTHN